MFVYSLVEAVLMCTDPFLAVLSPLVIQSVVCSEGKRKECVLYMYNIDFSLFGWCMHVLCRLRFAKADCAAIFFLPSKVRNSHVLLSTPPGARLV